MQVSKSCFSKLDAFCYCQHLTVIINSMRSRSAFCSVLTMSSMMRSWSTSQSPWFYQTINKIITKLFYKSFLLQFFLSKHKEHVILNLFVKYLCESYQKKMHWFLLNFLNWNLYFWISSFLLLLTENPFSLPFLPLSKKHLKQWEGKWNG